MPDKKLTAQKQVGNDQLFCRLFGAVLQIMELEVENQWTEDMNNEEDKESKESAEKEKNNDEESNEKLAPPEVNTLFNFDREVYEYYRRYGLQNGFGVMIRNTRKVHGVHTYVAISCHRYGDPQRKVVDSLNPKPIVKSNCKARLCSKKLDDDTWCVTQFDNEHNHDISPSKAHHFRCNRKLTEHAKRSLNLYDEAGIAMNKSFNTLVVQQGGHENMTFNKKDCENYMRIRRRLRLEEGDDVALQNYFNKAQLVDSNFYYSIDLDDDNRIKNLS
ncbi:protein FAR-RED IMPAIRED RESPONSE 1-like [Apium graveolens]|uniref:protein FAR-RED IMPAIRED RESPONSE 1-like n=1 Tax=Apium graveolens TaxID=4045 RepID=UPI003D7B71DF